MPNGTHINEAFARNLMRQGSALFLQEAQRSQNKTDIAKRGTLSGYITGEVIPGVADGSMGINDAIREVQSRGNQLGLDPADSIGLMNGIFQAQKQMGPQLGGGGIKNLLAITKLETEQEKLKKLRGGPREKLREETIGDTVASVRGMREIIEPYRGDLKRGDIEGIVDDLGGQIPGLERGFFERNIPKTPEQLASVLARHLSSQPEFGGYDLKKITKALQQMIAGNSEDAVFRALGIKEESRGLGGLEGQAFLETLAARGAGR